jgi:predicted transcriptional regulator
MYGGNQSRAADSIGITASSLSRYLKGMRIRDDGKLKKWLDRGGKILDA